MNISRRGGWLLVSAMLLSSSGWAQFRSKAPTEAQRLTYDGEDLTTEGSKALTGGDKAEAKEKFEEALGKYEEALKADPNLTEAAVGYGVTANLLGANDKVVKVLLPFAQAHPDAEDVSYNLGVALFRLKRSAEAATYLERISALEKPEHLLGQYYLGYHYVAAGRGEQAVVALERYLKRRPEPLKGNDFEINGLLGRAWLMQRKPAEARLAFEKAQAGRPESVPFQLGLASCLELEGKQAETMAFLEALAKRQPRAPEPRERLGRMLLAAGDTTKAFSTTQELLNLGPTPISYHLAGDVLLAQKKPKDAENLLRLALKGAPDSLPIKVSLASALQKQQKNDEAISLLEQAAAAGAAPVEALAALGSLYRRANRFEKAVENHQKVVAANPKGAFGHQLLGADYFSTGEWDKAISEYDLALTADPQNPRIRHFLALSLSHRGQVRVEAKRLVDGLRDLRRALDLDRAAPMARNVGLVLLAQGDADARTVLTEGVTLPGATWRDHLWLGYAQLTASDPAAAVLAFEKAAALTPEPNDQAEIYTGWALAKLQLGEFDTAVQRLSETGLAGAGAKVAEGNLPLALARRALQRLEAGDAEAATKDITQAEGLPGAKRPEIGQLLALGRALVALEEGSGDTALKKLRAATPTNVAWAFPNTRALLESYVSYRVGNLVGARKTLASAAKQSTPAQQAWSRLLTNAINRRDGEIAYGQGKMKPAQLALKAALDAEPLNPFVLNNNAAVLYRSGKMPDAIKAWEQVEANVPEASLNLGIDAQEKKKDFAKATKSYKKYLAAGGNRVVTVREWVERLESLYGGVEGEVAPAPVEAPGGTP